MSSGLNEIEVYGQLAGGVVGDFNGDGVLDAADIDDLTGQSASGLHVAKYDLNGDTLVDEDDVNVWIKDLFNSWVGDANLNGEFNSGDLVVVLSSGTYEADVDAVWSTGDFNGDGRANSSDLVAALSDGGYELGPRAAVQAVPGAGDVDAAVARRRRTVGVSPTRAFRDSMTRRSAAAVGRNFFIKPSHFVYTAKCDAGGSGVRPRPFSGW